ncbi:MAG TPA: hotdog fold domain-containing protein [Rhodocyclaceae bacterium]|nr:hotdog fold domain-containing protein [Rhodocyclaceae bacterium]
MSEKNRALAIWRRLSALPFGKWMFSKFICLQAPYFGTIKPLFETLEPGCCEVRFKKRRGVLNHIGSVHAIAMCNVAELAGGTMTEVSIPSHKRWIPKGMTVEYVRKATTDVTAIATPDATADVNKNGEYPVNVTVADREGTEVFRARITMWLSDKKAAH